MAEVIARAHRDERQRWSRRVQQGRGRGGGAAVVGDLEDVEAGEPSGDQLRVHALLRIAHEEEVAPRRRAQEDDRGVVDARASRRRRQRHGPRPRPEDVERDVTQPEPRPRGQCPARRAVPERLVPRLPAGPRPAHPRLEHAPHPVALQHPDETRDVVLVGVREHDDVEAPIPGRQGGVEFGEDAVWVRAAIDEHPRPVAALHEDCVALAHVKHDDPVCTSDDVRCGEQRHRDDQRRTGQCEALEAIRRADPRDASPGLRWPSRWSSGRGPRCAGSRPCSSPPPDRQEHAHDERERAERGGDRDVWRQGDRSEGQPGREPHRCHDHAQQQPPRQPGEDAQRSWQAELHQPPADQRQGAARHGSGHDGHHGQVDCRRDERQPAERREHVGQGGRLGRERDPEALRKPAGEPPAPQAAEPGAKRRRPGEEPCGREHRQAEPGIADQPWVEEEQPSGCERERRRRPDGTARPPREQHDAGHDRGPDHRRRGAGCNDVRDDHAAGHQPGRATRRPAPKHRRDERGDDRDVPAGDRHDVAHAGAGEVRREASIDALAEADQDARGQARLGFGEGQPQSVPGTVAERLDGRPGRRPHDPHARRPEAARGAGSTEVLAVRVVVGRGPQPPVHHHDGTRGDQREGGQRRRDHHGRVGRADREADELAPVLGGPDGDDVGGPRWAAGGVQRGQGAPGRPDNQP